MERIAARTARVSAHDLENAIRMFFHAIDENGNGKLEPYEFAVAQSVVAQLAGEDFDEEAFDSIGFTFIHGSTTNNSLNDAVAAIAFPKVYNVTELPPP